MRTIACDTCGHAPMVKKKGVPFAGTWYACPRCGESQFVRPAKTPRIDPRAEAFERAMDPTNERKATT
jgi:DNA-directed RNA polymerase subunit RPC12/RpoP